MKTTSCTMNTGSLKNYKKFRTIMYRRTDSKIMESNLFA